MPNNARANPNWKLAHAPIPDGPIAPPNFSDRLHAIIVEKDAEIAALRGRLRTLQEVEWERLLIEVSSAADAEVRDALTDARRRLSIALTDI